MFESTVRKYCTSAGHVFNAATGKGVVPLVHFQGPEVQGTDAQTNAGTPFWAAPKKKPKDKCHSGGPPIFETQPYEPWSKLRSKLGCSLIFSTSRRSLPDGCRHLSSGVGRNGHGLLDRIETSPTRVPLEETISITHRLGSSFKFPNQLDEPEFSHVLGELNTHRNALAMPNQHVWVCFLRVPFSGWFKGRPKTKLPVCLF